MPDRILEMQERIDELENALAQAAHDLAATADRATALAQMRQRVTDESIKDTRRAFIWLDNEGERECYVTVERRFYQYGAAPGEWLPPVINSDFKNATFAHARDLALALEVLAEIAEQWEREAAGEAASE